MNKIYIGIGSITLMAAMAVMVFGFPVMTPEMSVSDSPTWNAMVCPTITRADGSVEKLDCTSNLLTNLGKNFTAEVVSGQDLTGAAPGTDYAKHISLSLNSGAADATWLVLPSEIIAGGLDRNTGTITTNSGGNVSIAYEFTASATHTAVHLAGLKPNYDKYLGKIWNVTDGANSLVAVNALSSDVNLESGDFSVPYEELRL